MDLHREVSRMRRNPQPLGKPSMRAEESGTNGHGTVRDRKDSVTSTGAPVHEVDLHMRCPSQDPCCLPLEDTCPVIEAGSGHCQRSRLPFFWPTVTLAFWSHFLLPALGVPSLNSPDILHTCTEIRDYFNHATQTGEPRDGPATSLGEPA